MEIDWKDNQQQVLSFTTESVSLRYIIRLDDNAVCFVSFVVKRNLPFRFFLWTLAVSAFKLI